LPDPDNIKQKRRQLRIEDENKRFDDDHYLADFFDNSSIIEQSILNYRPLYLTEDANQSDYTQKDMDDLKNLPKKTYLLDKEQKYFAYTGLVDILYAYCYNDRINCGENNVESGWTIAKLSSTLSWLDVRFLIILVSI
jgi:protein SHQ1